MEDINKRVVRWMEHTGFSKARFSSELEISMPLLTHVISGRNRPGLDLLQKLLLKFNNLNPEWLINGTGDMLKQQTDAIDINEALNSLSRSEKLLAFRSQELAQVIDYQKILMDEIQHIATVNQQLLELKSFLTQTSNEMEHIRMQLESKVKNQI